MTEGRTLSLQPERTSVCLIGVSEYPRAPALDALPAVRRNLADLADALRNPAIIGLEPKRITTVGEHSAPHEILESVVRLSKEAEDTFLLYYAGHGLVDTKTDGLLLTTHHTTSEAADFNSVRFEDVRHALQGCRAPRKVLIIDSCFSARALGTMGASVGLPPDPFAVEGTYTLASAPRDQASFSPPGRDLTAFTGALVHTLRHGIQNDRPVVTLEELYEALRRQVAHDRFMQEPQQSTSQSIGRMAFCKNVAFKAARTPEPSGPPARSARQPVLRVLLVKTSIRYPIKEFDFGVPLGPWLLKSYLRSDGIHADVYDERLEQIANRGSQFATVANEYDVIGFSGCTCEVPELLARASAIRPSGKKTIVGGIFANTNERYLLDSGVIDYVIPGAATTPLSHLLRNLANGVNNSVPGVRSRSFGTSLGLDSPVYEPNALPTLDRHTRDEMLARYQPHLSGKIDLVTSRGCPHRCTFCSIQMESRRHVARLQPVVVDEIVYYAKRGFTKISIKDEIFPLVLRRANGLLRESSRRLKSEGLAVEFKIKSRIDILVKHKDLLRNYYEWGVREIQFGVETTSDPLLRSVHKGYALPLRDVRSFLEYVAGLGILVNASFVLGIHGETGAYYDDLRRFVEGLSHLDKFKVYINFYTPHPYQGRFAVPGDGRLLMNDLACFTHKIPVMVPETSRTRAQRQQMLDAYEDIVALTNARRFNPVVPEALRHQMLEGQVIRDHQLPPLDNRKG